MPRPDGRVSTSPALGVVYSRDCLPTPVERGMWVSDCLAPWHIKSILFVLAAHENNHTHAAIVSVATLAAGSGLSESAVHRSVREAVAAGWLDVQRPPNSASHYYVLWMRLPYRKPTPRRSRRS